ncbi:exonuclease SbcCD subunit D [Blautia glucerasea]
MIRFIHLADVHLGAVPDRGCPWSHEREEEIWETFRRVIASVRKDPVDFLFIAGDLFHRQPLLKELKEVNYLFSTIPETRVFLMAGNHDHIKQDSFYKGFPWEANVTFFEQEMRSCVEIPELDTFVYGMSYQHQEIREPLYDTWKPEDKPGFHVLLAHGGDGNHVPMDMKRLVAAGFSYLALGHIHKPQAVIRGKALYPGALEPIDRNDTGEHGYILGSYDEGRIRLKFMPFASRSYQNLLLTMQETTTQFSLEEMVKNEIFKRGGKNIYRIILRGWRSPELILLTERLKKLGNIVEILDESKPAYDLEELYRKYTGTLIGDYVGSFMGRDLTVVEEKALYHGLQALLETSILNR